MESKVKVEITQQDIDKANCLLKGNYHKEIGDLKLDLTDNIKTYQLFRKIINFYQDNFIDISKSDPEKINNVDIIYNKLLKEGLTKTYQTIESLDINPRVKTTLLYSFN
jgi:hypothetical protein